MKTESKREFYKNQGVNYKKNDLEAINRYKNILHWLILENEKTIIEIGCKYAELKKLLVTNGSQFKYKGIDIDKSTLEKIENYNSSDYICHDVNKGIPLKDNSADYIICMEVLEHLENATFFLDESKRVLNKNGRLILSVPNPYSWNEIYRNMFKKNDTEGHIASFTYQNLNALIKFSGLKIIDELGSFTRVPLSKKIFGRYFLLSTNNFFLTRNKIYLIKK
tara:strand:+ start:8892 stop:9557 length:666 start_codon:yes stop_codon:yes gene_type:complete